MASTMPLLFVFVLGIFASQLASSRLLSDESILQRHQQWMSHHGRIYKDEEEKDTRFKIFKENVKLIDAFNAGEERGYKLSVNKFADLTNEEFKASHNGYKRKLTNMMSVSGQTYFSHANVTVAPIEAMDWRSKGAVTPVKNQGSCGSCWAFSAVAAIESVHQLKTGKLVSLSEQELIDCDVQGQDEGCNGGLMDNTFKFIINNKGLTTEANYPYEGQDGTCNKKRASTAAAKITGYEDVPSNDEKALLRAVASQPVSVAIDAGGYEFQFYSGGVFAGGCGTSLDHAVSAVGYGTTSDGTKYWLVKNSWGSGWGEKGYMRMKRDVDAAEGLCGIAMKASYPIM